MINPLTKCVEDYALPPFAQIRPSHIVPAVCTAIREYALDLNAIEDDLAFLEDDITWESVMDRLEIIDDPLNRLWRIVFHLSNVANTAELREAKAEVQAEVLAIQSRRLQSVEIFEAMQTLRDGPQWSELTSEQQRILDRALLEMKLNGVALAGGAREQFNEIDVRLKDLSDIFSNNVLDSTKSSTLLFHDRSQLDGVPECSLAEFARDAVASGHDGATAANGPYAVNVTKSLTVLKTCSNRATREAICRAQRLIASSEPHDNTPVIQEMLQLRQEKAQLLGYTTFAEMNLADKMAPSVQVVQETLRELRDNCFAIAAVEVDEVNAFAEVHGQTAPVETWDIKYWVERMRKEKYAIDDEVIRPYFPLSTVLPRIFEFLTKLFGISIETADESEETWHPDVLFYQIRAKEQPGEPVIAQFYLDLFARPGEKMKMSWIEVVASRSRVLQSDKNNVRIPVFALMFNYLPPARCYLNVSNLFVVLGFGLRIGLTSADHTEASRPHGIEWDVVGFSSQFMRNFSYHRETLQSISSHVETGEQLPDELFDKILEARSFMRAFNFAAVFLEIAACDIALHHEYDPYSESESIFDVFRRTSEEFTLLPPFPDDKSVCSIMHIFPGPYPSCYYSYLWSEMLAADAYASFAEAKSESEWMALGRKYRDTILAMTGPAHPLEAFERFRGRLPTTEGLLKQYNLE
ncbi:hypothetical protein LEN26_012873 [Aphanomyces euteiches]|nr:hypothetical protein LEN26_012873 [Aphanomyces euteiches]